MTPNLINIHANPFLEAPEIILHGVLQNSEPGNQDISKSILEIPEELQVPPNTDVFRISQTSP